MTITVGVFGATGYTGYELVKLLLRHPHVHIACLTSRTYAGRTLDAVYPAAPPLPLVDGDAVDLSTIDVAFLCLPHAASAATAARCVAAGCKVIDLSADFRLQDLATYETWYHTTHPAPELIPQAIYGLTEWQRDAIATADLVACPGCYPTSILLPLLPLVAAGLATGPIVADAKSGVSGAGRKAKIDYHFVEMGADLRPYAIGRAHRHLPEMEQALHAVNPDVPPLVFSPHLVPMPRGIVSTIYVPTAASADDVHACLTDRYADEPFITVLPLGQPATAAHAVHTNRCAIGVTAAAGMAIVTGAIDNLIKGSGGQGVQNMNVMYGWPETAGLAEGLARQAAPYA